MTSESQAEARDRTRNALLKAAAHELSRSGYADFVSERVANEFWSSLEEGSPAAGDLSADADSGRPELSHLFRSKEKLVLTVVKWMEEAWNEEVGYLFADEADPVGALLAVARGHAVFCRTMAPVGTALKAEFEGREHPVGRAINQALGRFIDDTVRLITKGRRSGEIPPGPPPRVMAFAYLGALDWVVSTHRGEAPLDALLAEKAALGILGLGPETTSGGRATAEDV
jgi:AcrR family transcriptional regulator